MSVHYLSRLRISFLVLLVVGLLSPLTTAVSAENIELNTSNGTLKLDELKGQVVYLDFWASWCGPCRKSFPWLNKMQQDYAAKGFKVVAVNLDKQRTDAERFLAKYPASFVVAFDPEGDIASQLKVSGMPSSFLIDRNGHIVSSHVGFLEKNTPELENKIRHLLTQERS